MNKYVLDTKGIYKMIYHCHIRYFYYIMKIVSNKYRLKAKQKKIGLSFSGFVYRLNIVCSTIISKFKILFISQKGLHIALGFISLVH